MAIQHTQSHCLACKRPTLHVRNTYDVPHLGHLVFFCALWLAGLFVPNATLTVLFGLAAVVWLAAWAAHTLANWLSASEPFRCHACGTPAATGRALADATEQQRLQAALAKAAAKRQTAGA
jgi:hypothetical protein